MAPVRSRQDFYSSGRGQVSLHWVLDVVMDEDQARNRRDHGPENLALLRRFALNLLQTNTSKGSTRLKAKRAGWRDDFLLGVLAQLG